MMLDMDLALDHILYAGPDLDRLVRETGRLAGETPSPGGRHPGMGTRNALLGLAPGAYLELIAPDPDQSGGSFADGIAGLRAPELHAWCVRTDDPDALASRIEAAGHDVVRRAISRSTPEGERLSWELLFATGHDWAGAAPFFIAWGATPHPAVRLEGRLRLRSLTALDPDAERLAAWLRELGLPAGPDTPVRVETAPRRGLRAEMTGPRGPLALYGGAAGVHLDDA